MSYWSLSKILLTSAVIWKQKYLHENDIWNIFKTTNVMTLIKIIVESPYKVLQMT